MTSTPTTEPQGMQYRYRGSLITRTPEHPGYTELGSWDQPGEDMTINVDGVPIGGTSWCPNAARPDGQRWDSWGYRLACFNNRTREDAERVQIDAYLDMRADVNARPLTWTVTVGLRGGGNPITLEVPGWTWAQARQYVLMLWSSHDVLELEIGRDVDGGGV
jgi:hypothetical protein